jgi:hypothetical protein
MRKPSQKSVLVRWLTDKISLTLAGKEQEEVGREVSKHVELPSKG